MAKLTGFSSLTMCFASTHINPKILLNITFAALTIGASALAKYSVNSDTVATNLSFLLVVVCALGAMGYRQLPMDCHLSFII
jgi:hypothetical protein